MIQCLQNADTIDESLLLSWKSLLFDGFGKVCGSCSSFGQNSQPYSKSLLKGGELYLFILLVRAFLHQTLCGVEMIFSFLVDVEP